MIECLHLLLNYDSGSLQLACPLTMSACLKYWQLGTVKTRSNGPMINGNPSVTDAILQPLQAVFV